MKSGRCFITEALSAVFMPKIKYTQIASQQTRSVFLFQNEVKEVFLCKKPMRIFVNDNGILSLPAYAILDNMLNFSEMDYRTFDEMCSFFPQDKPSTVRNALTELKNEKYIIIINGSTYAVNKLRIPNMKLR